MSSSERLREARKQRGISQTEVAERLGVARQTVSRWECGESDPTLENLRGLADVYGMTVDALLNGAPESGEPEPAEVVAVVPAAGPRRSWKRWALALCLTAALIAAAAGFAHWWANRPIPMDKLESGVIDLSTAEELYLLPLE